MRANYLWVKDCNQKCKIFLVDDLFNASLLIECHSVFFRVKTAGSKYYLQTWSDIPF